MALYRDTFTSFTLFILFDVYLRRLSRGQTERFVSKRLIYK
jgi:hypothetical protein